MKSAMKHLVGGAAAAAFALGLAAQAQAQAETFKVGIVTFLSGGAAESFGVPAWNGGKLLIKMMNEGALPAPYDQKGFGGLIIEPVVIDEAGGATKQVQEYRNLVQREKVDAVLGYVSSGDCLAVPPVAEELKAFLVLYDCGTPRVFEEGSYEYVFRTASHAAMDNISLAKYMVASMGHLMPDAEVKTALFPKIFAGQYGTEISAVMREKPDLLHSSLWGGDLQAFILQATARGLHKRMRIALAAGDHVIPQLGQKMPDGVVLGARGVNGLAAKARGGELVELMWAAYEKEYGVFPVQAPFRMWQGLLGLKTAVETAMAANGGKKPTAQELAAAMKGQTWEAPSGTITMALGGGHQAIQPNAVGLTLWDEAAGKMTLVDVEYYGAKCVNPPEGTKAVDWIKAGFPGAECN